MDTQFHLYWENVIGLLNEIYTPVSIETVIKPMEPLEIADGCFTVYAPSGYVIDTAEHRYKSTIEKHLKNLSGLDYKLRFVPNKDFLNTESKKLPADSPAHGSLNAKYLFTNFVNGKSNELAYAASVAVAEKPGLTMYNPLFIYGGVGLGKTHLMHSIGNLIVEQNPDKRVLYTTTENFTNEFVNALLKNKNQAFRNKYRDIDVLLLDDIQFLSDKESTQEELFHTFNTLHNANKQIVISSDLPPKELKTIEERLTSRFGNGLTVDITHPDIETRTAILEKKAELENIIVPKEIIRFIAKSIVSNIRELEGALIRVIAFSRLDNGAMTLPMAENVLKHFISGKEKRKITIDYVIESTAKYFSVTVDELKGKKRTQNIVKPRHMAMYLCRKLSDVQSLTLIGQSFGGRDHTTVIHGCDKIALELEHDSSFKNTVMELEKLITGN